MFDGICEAIHREMDMLDEKYASGKAQLNSQDLDNIEKMTHALISMKKYEALDGSSEYGGSYARGRSRATGRYISREGGMSREYYHEPPNGYDR